MRRRPTDRQDEPLVKKEAGLFLKGCDAHRDGRNYNVVVFFMVKSSDNRQNV